MANDELHLSPLVMRTGLISSSAMQLEKLKWNRWRATRFTEKFTPPEDHIFSAVDYAISATALRDWFKLEVTQKVRRKEFQSTRIDVPIDIKGADIEKFFRNLINLEITFQQHFDAIANSSKHGTPSKVEGGEVRLRLRPWGSEITDEIADEFSSKIINAKNRMERNACMSQIPYGCYWSLGLSPWINGEIRIIEAMWQHWARWRCLLVDVGYSV